MRIQVYSDLHLEFHKDLGKEFINCIKPKAEICILAGDITCFDKIHSTLKEFRKKFKHVIYVAGNHEYYGTSLDGIKTLRGELNADGVYWLENSDINIDGQRFVGTTLWFKPQPLMQLYKSSMSCFSMIEGFANFVGKENESAVQYLKEGINKDDIVITHYLPSSLSVADRYKGNTLNQFFVCELGDTISILEPKLWIHGHTHFACDYMLNKTRVYCNPMGYPGELKSQYSGKVITV